MRENKISSHSYKKISMCVCFILKLHNFKKCDKFVCCLDYRELMSKESERGRERTSGGGERERNGGGERKQAHTKVEEEGATNNASISRTNRNST